MPLVFFFILSSSKYSTVFHNLILSVDAVATCPPAIEATQLIGPDSNGVRNVRSRFGEDDDVDDGFRTSQISIVPFRRPAKT